MIDGGDGAAARARRIRRSTEVDRKVARADRRRDRGRRVPADRHRRHAERGVQRCSRTPASSDLGIHTEMLVDGMVDLVEAGIVTGAPRSDRPVPDRLHLRRRVAPPVRLHATATRASRSYPVDYTNLPDEHHAATTRVVSINNTTQIDLQGQAASESDGPPPPHRHRRPAPVRPRRLRVPRRQVVHLPRVHLRASAASGGAAS